MEKLFIKNRKGQRICVVLEKSNNQKGLVFLIHWLGDSKDSDHIITMANVFKKNKYTVVRFDTTNTFGESDGNFEDANITTYYEDMQDVIYWATNQDFFEKPFVLCGHSLGAICSAFYAENHPADVKALAPFASVINADLSRQNYTKEELENREKTGRLTENRGKFEVKIKWSYMKEKEKYDLLKKAEALVMPVLMVVGENDNTTSLKSQKILFDKLPGKKELHVIKKAPHTFRKKEHLEVILTILDAWIKTYL